MSEFRLTESWFKEDTKKKFYIFVQKVSSDPLS